MPHAVEQGVLSICNYRESRLRGWGPMERIWSIGFERAWPFRKEAYGRFVGPGDGKEHCRETTDSHIRLLGGVRAAVWMTRRVPVAFAIRPSKRQFRQSPGRSRRLGNCSRFPRGTRQRNGWLHSGSCIHKVTVPSHEVLCSESDQISCRPKLGRASLLRFRAELVTNGRQQLPL